MLPCCQYYSLCIAGLFTCTGSVRNEAVPCNQKCPQEDTLLDCGSSRGGVSAESIGAGAAAADAAPDVPAHQRRLLRVSGRGGRRPGEGRGRGRAQHPAQGALRSHYIIACTIHSFLEYTAIFTPAAVILRAPQIWAGHCLGTSSNPRAPPEGILSGCV